MDRQSSRDVEPSSPSSDTPARPVRRRFRLKPRPPAFQWIILVVGALVGLASLGLLIVLIVALWPSGKRQNLSGKD